MLARTGVQFPAPPPIRFGGNKPFGLAGVGLSGFLLFLSISSFFFVFRQSVPKMCPKMERRHGVVAANSTLDSRKEYCLPQYAEDNN